MEQNVMDLEGKRVLPVNFGPLRDADGNARVTGPCGDTVEMWLQVVDGDIEDATATSDGCEHSITASCMVASMVIGMPVAMAGGLSEQDVLSVLSDYPESSRHCVTLSLEVLRKALEDHALRIARRWQRTVAREPVPVLPDGVQHERRTLMVMSGKGGVGKSTVAVNLAVSLAREGLRVGLVDVDIHGPSIPTMLNLTKTTVYTGDGGIVPVVLEDLYGLEVMSLGFLLQNPDDPVVWRGPLKNSLIEQFLKDVQWGDLDYLVVDCPPGTGDEPLSVAQQLENKAEAVLVTTPQEVSTVDVARSINFARKLNLPILGIVENMSGFICQHCHHQTDIFRTGGGRMLAQRYGVPFLGAIPLDPAIGLAGDAGQPFVQRFNGSPISETYRTIARAVRSTRSELL